MRSWLRGFIDWFLSHNPAAGPNLPDTPDWNAIARANAAREQAEAEDLRRLKEWLVWRESQEISGPWRKPGDN